MGQISDLSATDRLRTGTQLEIQDPINGSDDETVDLLLAGQQWDTSSQIAGATSANVMEVEATNLAARMHLMPDEANYPPAGWRVGRYMGCNSNFTYPVAAANVTDANDLAFMWLFSGGICIPKKITCTLIFGAATAPAAGEVDVKLFMMYGLSLGVETLSGTSISLLSPSGVDKSQNAGPGGLATALGQLGLSGNQPPSQLRIDDNTTMPQQGFLDKTPIGHVISSKKASAGQTAIQNKVLYDYQVAEQPIVLSPGTGLQMTNSLPSGTSTTFQVWLTYQWDEWTMITPNDR